MVIVLVVICIGFQIWDNVSFRDNLAQDHADSIAGQQRINDSQARINCEIAGWNVLWNTVVADQNAEAAHQKPPKFIVPKKC
jgi:hypothetical protein